MTYECEVGEDRFKVNLATYNYSDGEGSMQYIIDNNSDAFSEEKSGGARFITVREPILKNIIVILWYGKEKCLS